MRLVGLVSGLRTLASLGGAAGLCGRNVEGPRRPPDLNPSRSSEVILSYTAAFYLQKRR